MWSDVTVVVPLLGNIWQGREMELYDGKERFLQGKICSVSVQDQEVQHHQSKLTAT